MANLRQHGNGPYHLEFRFAGKKFQRSLRTSRKAEANRLQATVEKTLEYLQRGVLTIPTNSSADDLWAFLISGGKNTPKAEPQLAVTKSLSVVCEQYLSSYAEGSKEESTLKTEGLHCRNLQRTIGKRKQMASITSETIQAYVLKRQKGGELIAQSSGFHSSMAISQAASALDAPGLSLSANKQSA